jgi:putative ABC transport system permease protein
MRIENLFLMSWQNLLRNKRRVIFSSVGVVIGIATLIFFIALTTGSSNLIFEHFLKKLPADQVRLNPVYKANIASVAMREMMGQEHEKKGEGGDRISPEDVAKILSMPGVSRIHGLQQIETDCILLIELPGGNEASTKLGLCAYETAYIEDDIPADVSWTFDGDEKIPLLINQQTIIAFNETMSGSFYNLKLDIETFKMLSVVIQVKNLATNQYQRFPARIVGASNEAPLFSPMVPAEFVEEMNRQMVSEDYEAKYSSLIVELEDSTHMPELKGLISEMNLEISAEQKLAQMISTGITAITFFLTSISLIIVFISLMNVFNIYMVNVMERRFEIGLLRSVGASRGNVRSLFLLESAFIGLANGLVGAVLSILAILAAEAAVTPMLIRFIGEGTSFFIIDPWLVLLVVAASPLVNVLSVLQPANYAANLDPIAALRR